MTDLPRGFRAAGATGGIKASGRPDVAVIVSDLPAAAAGLFTKSRTAGPAVGLCRELLGASGGRARAIVINSGNANTATGPLGRAHAQRMGVATADLLGIEAAEVLVASTGVIGVPLPIEAVERGIRAACASLSPDGARAAAEAMMTTDAWPKIASARVRLPGGTATITGVAKGAGMIRPDLGTLIVALATDARCSPTTLRAATQAAADASFNRITVDGSTSTSDTLAILANGASGADADADLPAFTEELIDVCRELALSVVRDGEGASRIACYTVVGARSGVDADRAARRVAEDQLVRCALNGADPNWGRIVAALGVADVDIDIDRLSIAIGGATVFRGGTGVPGAQAAAARAAAAPVVEVRVDLALGDGRAEVYGSDLGHAYVSLNAEYTT